MENRYRQNTIEKEIQQYKLIKIFIENENE